MKNRKAWLSSAKKSHQWACKWARLQSWLWPLNVNFLHTSVIYIILPSPARSSQCTNGRPLYCGFVGVLRSSPCTCVVHTKPGCRRQPTRCAMCNVMADHGGFQTLEIERWGSTVGRKRHGQGGICRWDGMTCPVVAEFRGMALNDLFVLMCYGNSISSPLTEFTYRM